MSAHAAPPNAGMDVALLSTFQKHIEDMRNLSLCKICIKPFYEPFILGCGHTYCYSCLASWFGGAQTRKKNKNCPDCRAEVTIQPSPNFLLRDLVHMFIGRAELLPEDETVHEHQQAREDEAVLLAADRAGPGLFKGVFKRPHPAHVFFPWARGILDHEDNVMRCPECHWELEDGQCLQCGFHEYEPGDSDFDSFDGSAGTPHTVDDEFDDEGDEVDYEFDVPIGALHALHPGYDSAATDDSGTDYGDDYDEEDDMDGFIERDDEPINDDARSVSTITGRRLDRTSRDRNYSSAAESDANSENTADNNYAGTQPEQSDNENYTDGANDQDEVLTNYDETTEASENEDANNFQPTSRYRGRIRRIIISDDEDDEDDSEDFERMPMERARHGAEDGHEVDGNEDEMLDEEEGDSEASGSDESDIRPPHSAARRMQHLHSQRARRSNFGPYAPYQPHRPSSHGPRTNPSRQRSRDRYEMFRRIPVGGGNRHF
ncbi:E3 ubiquitin ligase [Exophiala xenobiotica]|nr:E3 ubiquitin ligase [Exophiala xenobiotica]KAK5212353.1 E3 ubiquitin ligase [Exophiala xenobiotica]KAK5252490.1 E3 ubiquitin ligase [Exophiala xenobiotica]KAK5348275.1 E3 ubiquitin ligase [Exophiala xenobiotica]KAK5362773.1 E3 ubiquitin ligase [Exophiala xenobiotica]